ncbi:WXG100 family type VII secretion target [Nocardioides sp. Leaf307]|uniref:WXG100 family type VII secretion target n=1 Tax=Nocardioides sp. Leaf307 TaxID=1736331 RepID=UPI000702CC73|nr:WXG100 family type VII secretion target [Nocardioides sp. Leaf307]KQQ42061.1 hypothetical protein ASF50_14485 [Nocardioides sp. Leaf307]
MHLDAPVGAAGPAGALALDHAATDAAVADLRDTAADLARSRSRLGREVDGLLDAVWRGRAADSFAVAWADWAGAADAVVAALDETADRIARHHRDVTDLDVGVADGLAALAARLDGSGVGGSR